MYFDKDALINQLTQQDIIKIVTDLGSEGYKEKDNYISFQTICHNLPHTGAKYNLIYYPTATEQYPAKIFHCYSGTDCGCGDTFGIFELVLRAKRVQGFNWSFPQAIKYVAEVSGKILTGHSSENQDFGKVVNDWSWMNKFINSGNAIEPKKVNTLNDNILEVFQNYHHPDWLHEGIKDDVMYEFEIKYWTKTNQIIIPFRDVKGELIGIRGRNLNEEELQQGRKYVPVTVEGKTLKHPLGDSFYGLYQNQDNIKRFHKAILYESEKSVLKNRGYFGSYNDFSIAACGSNITAQQIRILKEDLKIQDLIIAFDKEYKDINSAQAQIYIRKLIHKAQSLLPYMAIDLLIDKDGLLDYKDSPADKGKDVLLKLLDNKQRITTETIEQINNTELF